MTTQASNPRQAPIYTEPDLVVPEPLGPIVLRLPPFLHITDSFLLELSSLNEALRLELNAQGELEILPPAGLIAANRNAKVTTTLGIWAESDDRGEGFDSSTGFTLPNGAVRSPDASWILKSRLAEMTEEDKRGFWNICPDFVIELRSSSDRIRGLHAKMEEYMENGIRLGWLIDPAGPAAPGVHLPSQFARGGVGAPGNPFRRAGVAGLYPGLETNLGAGLLTGVH